MWFCLLIMLFVFLCLWFTCNLWYAHVSWLVWLFMVNCLLRACLWICLTWGLELFYVLWFVIVFSGGLLIFVMLLCKVCVVVRFCCLLWIASLIDCACYTVCYLVDFMFLVADWLVFWLIGYWFCCLGFGVCAFVLCLFCVFCSFTWIELINSVVLNFLVYGFVAIICAAEFVWFNVVLIVGVSLNCLLICLFWCDVVFGCVIWLLVRDSCLLRFWTLLFCCL